MSAQTADDRLSAYRALVNGLVKAEEALTTTEIHHLTGMSRTTITREGFHKMSRRQQYVHARYLFLQLVHKQRKGTQFRVRVSPSVADGGRHRFVGDALPSFNNVTLASLAS